MGRRQKETSSSSGLPTMATATYVESAPTLSFTFRDSELPTVLEKRGLQSDRMIQFI